ncbi:MAG TPA: hypothetical protein VKU39_09405 [Streptosporangiaceae bacterium]|nr:hypothetical protein [Streptosporangiaceae bacterium]
MEFLMMLTGIVTGAAAASIVLLGWAASQLRWLAAHCHQHITYWREEAEDARAVVTRLREQHAADPSHSHQCQPTIGARDSPLCPARLGSSC